MDKTNSTDCIHIRSIVLVPCIHTTLGYIRKRCVVFWIGTQVSPMPPFSMLPCGRFSQCIVEYPYVSQRLEGFQGEMLIIPSVPSNNLLLSCLVNELSTAKMHVVQRNSALFPILSIHIAYDSVLFAMLQC